MSMKTWMLVGLVAATLGLAACGGTEQDAAATGEEALVGAFCSPGYGGSACAGDAAGTVQQCCSNTCRWQYDPNNCQRCGERCGSGTTCQARGCQNSAGQYLCGGVVKNLLTDASNCGKCGRSCNGNACINGSCMLSGALVPPTLSCSYTTTQASASACTSYCASKGRVSSQYSPIPGVPNAPGSCCCY